VALRKTGAATLTLAGTSSHTGATTVASGRLLVTGALGNTAVTVAPAGTLGGSGNIAGPVTVQGILAAGNLTCGGSLTLASTATLAWEIGASADSVQVAGDLVLDGSLHVTAAPGLAAGSYTLITHGGTLTDLGLEIASLPAGYTGTIDSSGGSVKLLLAPLLTPYESWQMTNFGSTTSPDAAPFADPDADGTSNHAEFRLGLAPRDGASAFRASLAGRTLTWPSAPGIVFTVKRSLTLDGGWDVVGSVIGGPGATATFVDPAALDQAFYRVEFTP
jgi:autotransporter-associated beta strand protein